MNCRPQPTAVDPWRATRLATKDRETPHDFRDKAMAKNKAKRDQKKKKDRERRVAKDKLATRAKATADQKVAQERTASEPQSPGTKPKKSPAIGAAKNSSFTATSKAPIYRRTGG
jgi:hypothetical protein